MEREAQNQEVVEIKPVDAYVQYNLKSIMYKVLENNETVAQNSRPSSQYP